MRDVTQRPQPLVGETVVVALFLFLGQPHPAERVMRIVGGNRQTPAFVCSFHVGVARSMRNPRPTAGIKYGFKSSNESARRNFYLNRSSPMHVRIWFTVRHNKQASILKSIAHSNGKPVGRPD